jgi:hypothetical protein
MVSLFEERGRKFTHKYIEITQDPLLFSVAQGIF